MRRIVVALCALASSVRAQERPTVLTLPAGARAMAVGNAFVAGRSPEVLFYNPAMLSYQPGVAASVQRTGTTAWLSSVASVYALPGGAAGIGVQWMEFTEAAGGLRATPPAPVVGVGASSMAATLALNGPTIKTIRIGLAAKYLHEQVGESRDGALGFDVGVGKEFFGRTTVGLAAQNLGGPLQIEGTTVDLPARVSLGIVGFAPPLGTYWDVAGAAQVSYLRDGTIGAGGGVEISFVPLDGWAFTGRVGGRRVTEGTDASPLTLGAGMSFDRLSLDYAFNAIDGGGVAHRVGFRIR
jgi:hypothetical protein